MRLTSSILCFCLLFCNADSAYAATKTNEDSLGILTLKEVKSLHEEVKNESSFINKWLPSIIAATGVILAGVINFAGGWKNTKRHSIANATAHFREKWIGDLRTSYCEFHASFHNVCAKISDSDFDDNKHANDDWRKYLYYTARIKLLLHHDGAIDADHVDFWKKFKTFTKANAAYFKEKTKSEETERNLAKDQNQVEAALLKVLHKEWMKTKNFK